MIACLLHVRLGKALACAPCSSPQDLTQCRSGDCISYLLARAVPKRLHQTTKVLHVRNAMLLTHATLRCLRKRGLKTATLTAMQYAHLHWVACEAARIASFPKALLTGRDEAGWDGIADNLPCKDKLLGLVFRKRLHVAYHTTILPLPTCTIAVCKVVVSAL